MQEFVPFFVFSSEQSKWPKSWYSFPYIFEIHAIEQSLLLGLNSHLATLKQIMKASVKTKGSYFTHVHIKEKRIYLLRIF